MHIKRWEIWFLLLETDIWFLKYLLVDFKQSGARALVTTRKDFVRIPKSYRPIINTLEGEIVFEKEDTLTEILSNVLENYFIKESSN